MATHSSILAWEDPMGRGAWQVIVYRVAKSPTRLHTHTHTHTPAPPWPLGTRRVPDPPAWTEPTHHVDEVGQDALDLSDVHVLHLHELQGHQECVQGQLVGLEQQVSGRGRAQAVAGGTQGASGQENFCSGTQHLLPARSLRKQSFRV